MRRTPTRPFLGTWLPRAVRALVLLLGFVAALNATPAAPRADAAEGDDSGQSVSAQRVSDLLAHARTGRLGDLARAVEDAAPVAHRSLQLATGAEVHALFGPRAVWILVVAVDDEDAPGVPDAPRPADTPNAAPSVTTSRTRVLGAVEIPVARGVDDVLLAVPPALGSVARALFSAEFVRGRAGCVVARTVHLFTLLDVDELVTPAITPPVPAAPLRGEQDDDRDQGRDGPRVGTPPRAHRHRPTAPPRLDGVDPTPPIVVSPGSPDTAPGVDADGHALASEPAPGPRSRIDAEGWFRDAHFPLELGVESLAGQLESRPYGRLRLLASIATRQAPRAAGPVRCVEATLAYPDPDGDGVPSLRLRQTRLVRLALPDRAPLAGTRVTEEWLIELSLDGREGPRLLHQGRWVLERPAVWQVVRAIRHLERSGEQALTHQVATDCLALFEQVDGPAAVAACDLARLHIAADA